MSALGAAAQGLQKGSGVRDVLEGLHRMVTSMHYEQPTLSSRKGRLFLCACCRRIWDLLKDSRSRHAVEISEAFADRTATLEQLPNLSMA
jgi:hypothetical protein